MASFSLCHFLTNYILVTIEYSTYIGHTISPLHALALCGMCFPVLIQIIHLLRLESLYLSDLTQLSFSLGSQPDAYFQVPMCTHNAQWVFLPPVYHTSISHLFFSLS